MVNILRVAVALTDVCTRRAALGRVAASHPTLLESWARLSELSLAGGDTVEAYAFARVA